MPPKGLFKAEPFKAYECLRPSKPHFTGNSRLYKLLCVFQGSTSVSSSLIFVDRSLILIILRFYMFLLASNGW